MADQECDRMPKCQNVKEDNIVANGMDDKVDHANNVAEGEESTGSAPSPLFASAMPKKLRSKAWNDFIPIFVDGKIERAECMHCHQIFNSNSCNGTSNLLKHQAKCSPRAQKRPRQQKLPFLPSTQKSTEAAGFDPAQKKLPFLPSSQKKSSATVDTMPGQKKVASPDTPTDANRKNQEVDQNGDNEELIKMLALLGYTPLMINHGEFRKLAACLKPMVKMPSSIEVSINWVRLFEKEKAKLKENFAALSSRFCLSAHVWHYDPCSAFLCLSVHYIDDEWERQQKIIRFCPVDPCCNAKKLSEIILVSIGDWGLGGKIFSIALDDAFIDDSVATNVKVNLQERGLLPANRNLLVVRYATHLLDQIIQLGLDELDNIMQKSAKCSKYTKSSTPSAVWYPNCRYAPSPNDWSSAETICQMLEIFHQKMDDIHNCPSSVHLSDKLWYVKTILYRKRDNEDEIISNMLKKMQLKFQEYWKRCHLYFWMPMAMDPSNRLKYIETTYTSDNDREDYICEVRETLLSLFHAYSARVEDPDMLLDYDQYIMSQYERPLTELDQYLEEQCFSTGEPSVLQWWKEHNLMYPTIARMARDILAIPCSTDFKAATGTARNTLYHSSGKQWIEELVCIQDWLRSAGPVSVASVDGLE